MSALLGVASSVVILSCFAARSSRFFSLLAGNFSIKQLAGFPAGF